MSLPARRASCSVTAAIVIAAAGVAVAGSQRDSRGAWVGLLDEHPAIQYAIRPPSDAVSALNRRLDAGAATLGFDTTVGYLRSLLIALDVPIESQMLVLSRTGVQRQFTSPANPRALYFNEQVSVGYIRGSPFLELIAHDPEQGAVFYTLDQRPAERPALTRQTGCLTCHVAAATLEVPGFMTRSLFAGPDGTLKLRLGSQDVVDHRTPFDKRWGGFFVTGRHGRSTHLGNVVVDPGDVRRSLVPAGALQATTLEGAVDLARYPSAQSDVVALAVFDHQTRALNLLTRLGWEARVAAHEGRPPLEVPSVTVLVAETVDYLLFVDEAPMPGGLDGASGFREWFSRRGPKDARARSLHELDLATRLMKYPLSYVVYAPAFDALPSEIRTAIYRGIATALADTRPASRYRHLSRDDRRAIAEILGATKPDSSAHLAGL
jgi:hypothetical protein